MAGGSVTSCTSFTPAKVSGFTSDAPIFAFNAEAVSRPSRVPCDADGLYLTITCPGTKREAVLTAGAAAAVPVDGVPGRRLLPADVLIHRDDNPLTGSPETCGVFTSGTVSPVTGTLSPAEQGAIRSPPARTARIRSMQEYRCKCTMVSTYSRGYAVAPRALPDVSGAGSGPGYRTGHISEDE